jgi:hypothetical protein
VGLLALSRQTGRLNNATSLIVVPHLWLEPIQMGNKVQKGCNAMLRRRRDTTIVKLLVQLVNLVNFGFCWACVALAVHHKVLNFCDLVLNGYFILSWIPNSMMNVVAGE